MSTTKTTARFFLDNGPWLGGIADLMADVGGIKVKLAEVSDGKLDFEEVDFLNEVHGVDFISQEMLDEAALWFQSRCPDDRTVFVERATAVLSSYEVVVFRATAKNPPCPWNAQIWNTKSGAVSTAMIWLDGPTIYEALAQAVALVPTLHF